MSRKIYQPLPSSDSYYEGLQKTDMVRTRRREQKESAGYPDNSYQGSYHQGHPDNRMVNQKPWCDSIKVSEIFSNTVLILF